MPTIYNRLHRYGFTSLTVEQKKELGQMVAKAYHLADVKEPIRKRIQKEPNGTFTVLDYPPIFNERLDLIIHNYILKHGIARTPKPRKEPEVLQLKSQQKEAPKLRTRKVIQPQKPNAQPAYSFKRKNP